MTFGIKDIDMDIHVRVLCNYVYGTFHKKGLGYANILQIQNSAMNIDRKSSMKIHLSRDDFIMDMADWDLVKSEIDNNIVDWDCIMGSHTNLNNIEFDCQSTSLNERRYSIKFERDTWDGGNPSLFLYMDNKRIHFGFDLLDWETLKSNIDAIFWNIECSF